jgi:outer membrane protein, heavy metal efflux system
MLFNRTMNLSFPTMNRVFASAVGAASLAVGASLLWPTAAVAQAASQLPLQQTPRAAVGAAQAAADLYTLDRLFELARRENPALNAARAATLGTRAEISTAGALPNPEVELFSGSTRARRLGVATGQTLGGNIIQRIERPALREARVAAAEANSVAAIENLRGVENDLISDIKTRYYDLLRRAEEVSAAREDVRLVEQIVDRVKLRFTTGESARFDLIRAEAELTNARKNLEVALRREQEARAQLKRTVAPSLPDTFRIEGDFYLRTPDANRERLAQSMMNANPLLLQADAVIERASRRVEQEKAAVLPGLSVVVGMQREPEIRSTNVGVIFSVPLFDQRTGAIESATQELIRARNEREQIALSLQQQFEATWQRFDAARLQVETLEKSLLPQARQVVRVAEAAYRFGERGILEFLDAQRQFRLSRNELIAARLELYSATAELERLAVRELPRDN